MTSAPAPAKVRIRRRANGSETGAELAQEEYQFDSFGRVAKERRQMPGLDWVARDTTYDAMGQVSTVSEWYDESEAGTPDVTQYWATTLSAVPRRSVRRTALPTT